MPIIAGKSSATVQWLHHPHFYQRLGQDHQPPGSRPADPEGRAGGAKGGLKPSPQADRAILRRRVTFDLTGLPPNIAELDAFLADKSPKAYEKVVDRLQKSPRYGEHMSRFWLDAARYGDTHGLHLDNMRSLNSGVTNHRSETQRWLRSALVQTPL